MSRSFRYRTTIAALAASGLLCAPSLLARAQQAPQSPVQPSSSDIKTVTEAENVARQAEQAPDGTQPLPRADQPANQQSTPSQQPAASQPAQHDAPPDHTQPAHKGPKHDIQAARVAPEQLGLHFEKGSQNLRISEVPAESAAAELGLKAGDEIVSIGGQAVNTADAFSRALQRSLHVGQRNEHIQLPMVIRRDGGQQTIHWTNGALALAGYGPLLIQYGYYVPPQFITGYRGDGAEPSIPRSPRGAYLGVELNPQFPQAAIVSAVAAGSAAEQAGIEEGDRIWGINNQRIESANELVYAIGQLQPGEEVRLHFDRSHTVQVTLGQRERQAETRTGGAAASPGENHPNREPQREPAQPSKSDRPAGERPQTPAPSESGGK